MSRVGDRDERLRSPAMQRSTVYGFAEREGIELADWTCGVDVSGAKVLSSDLMALVERVEAGELAGIVVPKLDRLSRLPARDRLELLERIGHDRLLSATEPNDLGTPEGRMVRELFFLLARMEWEQKAETIELAKRNAVERGAYIANLAPFGYRFGEGHVLEVDELEAPIVAELFELRATGASWGAVLELFERRTGRSSFRQTVAHMLRNRAYIGHVVYGSADEGTLLENLSAHPAIVELDLWDRVQAVNRERAGLGPGEGHHAGAPVSLLAGIARCAGCGRGLTKSAGSNGRRDVYRCPSTAAKCSARASIAVDELDAYVRAELKQWADRGSLRDQPIEVELDASRDRDRIAQELGEAERLALAYETNVELELEIGSEAYAAGRQARRGLVERKRQELEALGELDEVESVRTTMRELETGPDAFTIEERRRMLRVVLAAVVVRRTPRTGAPASERAELVFQTASPDALEND